MRALLTELSYDKITQQIKSLSIYSVIANMALKEYLIYYLNIILATYFLIGHWPFALYMAFALVKYYLANNSDNNDINNSKDERIYVKMHMADYLWTTQQIFRNSGVKNTTIIPVLIVFDKSVLTKHAEDIT